MNEYRIRITRQANENLKAIRNYIQFELHAPIAARNTIASIKAVIQSLIYLPERIHLTPEQPWHDSGVRRIRVKNYYIYFWIDECNKMVQIISVIYVKREQNRYLQDFSNTDLI